jgi:hypothetical protein
MRAVRADCWIEEQPLRVVRRNADYSPPAKWLKRPESSRRWLKGVEMPKQRAVSGVEVAIADVKRLADLPQDWDDEGALRIDLDTINRVTSYLKIVSLQLASSGVELPAPTVSPCADGSIDLYWNQPKFRFLMNFKAGDQASDFYGESNSGLQVKGPFNWSVPDATLFHWLPLR